MFISASSHILFASKSCSLANQSAFIPMIYFAAVNRSAVRVDVTHSLISCSYGNGEGHYVGAVWCWLEPPAYYELFIPW